MSQHGHAAICRYDKKINLDPKLRLWTKMWIFHQNLFFKRKFGFFVSKLYFFPKISLFHKISFFWIKNPIFYKLWLQQVMEQILINKSITTPPRVIQEARYFGIGDSVKLLGIRPRKIRLLGQPWLHPWRSWRKQATARNQKGHLHVHRMITQMSMRIDQ